jgi:thiaminase
VSAAERATREKFIPNWTSKEFEDFVTNLGDLLDELVQSEAEGSATKLETLEGFCEEVWVGVLKAEIGFWPDVEESK